MEDIIICTYDESLLPEKKTDWAACFDFKAAKEITIPAKSVLLIPSWVRTSMPIWWVLKLYPRSSLPKKWLIFPHSVWIVDADYRWDIFIQVYNFKDQDITIEKWERIAQWEFSPCFVKSGVYGSWYIPNLKVIVDQLEYDNFALNYSTQRGEWWHWSTWTN